MNPDRRGDLEVTELLNALGRVDPPSHDALDGALEALWSAVAEEMFFAGEEGTADASMRPASRERRSNNSQHIHQRRRAHPGA